MINFGLLILELGMIYLSRGHLTKQLFRLISSRGDGRRAFTVIWSIIFLPGTIIHEMSHFFAAAFTGTHIGKVEIFPTFPRPAKRDPAPQDNDEQSIRLGSVETQQLGLFRGFIVGSAPFLIGLGLLIWLSSTLEISNFKFQISNFLQLYLFFTISNSLFLSWADFKHALPLIILGAIAGISLYFSGVNMALTSDSPVLTAISSLSKALTLSVIINFLILLIVRTINVIPGLTRNLYK